jgi:uncharacterized membrane protein YdjX (TVP38/TMEM64 family)
MVLSARFRCCAAVAVACVAVTGLTVSQLPSGALSSGASAVLTNVADTSGVGWMLILLLQTTAVALGVLPASLLAITAGMSYGLQSGFGFTAISTLSGGLVAFCLSRSFLRPFVTRLLRHRDRLRQFDELAAREGWRFISLLRLSPVMPFTVASYGLGLSSVSLRAYMAGTLACLPALFGYVVIGTIAKASLSPSNDGLGAIGRIMLGLGILATLLLVARTGQLAMRCIMSPSTGTVCPAHANHAHPNRRARVI